MDIVNSILKKFRFILENIYKYKVLSYPVKMTDLQGRVRAKFGKEFLMKSLYKSKPPCYNICKF